MIGNVLSGGGAVRGGGSLIDGSTLIGATATGLGDSRILRGGVFVSNLALGTIPGNCASTKRCRMTANSSA